MKDFVLKLTGMLGLCILRKGTLELLKRNSEEDACEYLLEQLLD